MPFAPVRRPVSLDAGYQDHVTRGDAAGITGQHRAEQHDLERELLFALTEAGLGGWRMDGASGDLSISDTFREILGIDVVSEGASDHAVFMAAIHVDDRSRVSEELRRWRRHEGDERIVLRIVRPDEETRWIELRRPPFPVEGDPPARLSGIAADLTDHCRNERLRSGLVELRNIFRDVEAPLELLESAAGIVGRTLNIEHVGFCDIDPDTNELVCRPAWAVSMHAGSVDEAIIRRSIDLLRNGDPVVVESTCSNSDATDPEVSACLDAGAMLITPIIEHGRLSALLLARPTRRRRWRQDERSFVREVADRSRIAMRGREGERQLATRALSLEQEVATRTSELHHAEESLRQAQKMETIGQLTGSVAHDFNNLLTVIRSATDLLQRPGASPERQARYIDAISETVDRAAKLTGQLLAFARRQALTPELIDVGHELAAIGDMLGTLTGPRIDVIVDLTDDACFINVDRSQFDTAVVNLAVNARDAMDGHGQLRIAVRVVGQLPPIRNHPAKQGSFVEIAISDTGTGIVPEQLERIFEPFFTTKGVGKGTGLGLSQVFGFVKQSGGNVAVESTLGRGTRFTLYLPEADRAANTPTPTPAATSDENSPLHILVVEDDVAVGRFTTEVLAELGHRTTWVENAEAALLALERIEADCDLVFSDVMMPGMSGIELGCAVRSDYPQLAVVLTSGYSDVLAQKGASGFDLLHKPYSAEQLSRALRKAIAAPPAAPARLKV